MPLAKRSDIRCDFVRQISCKIFTQAHIRTHAELLRGGSRHGRRNSDIAQSFGDFFHLVGPACRMKRHATEVISGLAAPSSSSPLEMYYAASPKPEKVKLAAIGGAPRQSNSER